MSPLDIAVVAGGASALGAAVVGFVRWVGPVGGETSSRAEARSEQLRAEGAASVRATGSGDAC